MTCLSIPARGGSAMMRLGEPSLVVRASSRTSFISPA